MTNIQNHVRNLTQIPQTATTSRQIFVCTNSNSRHVAVKVTAKLCLSTQTLLIVDDKPLDMMGWRLDTPKPEKTTLDITNIEVQAEDTLAERLDILANLCRSLETPPKFRIPLPGLGKNVASVSPPSTLLGEACFETWKAEKDDMAKRPECDIVATVWAEQNPVTGHLTPIPESLFSLNIGTCQTCGKTNIPICSSPLNLKETVDLAAERSHLCNSIEKAFEGFMDNIDAKAQDLGVDADALLDPHCG